MSFAKTHSLVKAPPEISHDNKVSCQRTGTEK